MTVRSSFLEFLVVWSDCDLQEVLITASNAVFYGQVNLYADPKEISEFANVIHGFPTSRDDKREFTFGQECLSGYGTAHVSLTCRDSIGHIWIATTMRSTPIDSSAPVESATVVISAAGSDIDRFEMELRALSGSNDAKALLCGAA
jgi:hypothetical protein